MEINLQEKTEILLSENLPFSKKVRFWVVTIFLFLAVSLPPFLIFDISDNIDYKIAGSFLLIAIIMIFSSYFSFGILLNAKNKSEKWKFVLQHLAFRLLFIFGILEMLYATLDGLKDAAPIIILHMIIFPIAVSMCGWGIYKFTKLLDKSTHELKVLSKEFALITEKMNLRDEELKASKIKLEKKNQDLETAIEDAYTLHLSFEKEKAEGTMKQENKSLKEKIDKLLED